MDEIKDEVKKASLTIPDIPLESFEIPDLKIKSELGIENTYTGSVQYGVIGCGQAGGRMAKSFWDQGYKKCIAINTAKADLNPLDLPETQKLKIGDAEGSGKDMSKGHKAAQDSYQRILDKVKTVFGTVDKIIICVGFGGGCFSRDTKISLLDGTERTIPEIQELLNSGENVEVYSYDESTKSIVPRKVEWAGMTKENQDMVEIVLDNDEKIVCTTDHPFLARSGEYIEARNLIEGQSLMPLYRRTDEHGYEQVLFDQENFRYTHDISSEEKYGKDYKIKFKSDDDYVVVHHNTYNKKDNRTNKLDLMLSRDHIVSHVEHNKSPEAREIASETMKKTMARPDMRERQIAHNQSQKMRNISGERIKEWNNSPEGKKAIEERLKFMNSPDSKHLRDEWYSSDEIKDVARKNLEIWNSSDDAKKQRIQNGIKTCSKQCECKICGYTNNPGNVAQHKKREHVLVNHKVKSVKFLEEKQNVYDLTVEEHHNFALSAGVFVHNTGAGSLPALVKIAQSYLDMLGNKNYLTDVIIIAALPTSGEKKSHTISTNLLTISERMKELVEFGQVGPLFIIDNAKIEALYRGISPAVFWSTVNNTISGLFQTFNYLSTQESDFTSFDAEDYKMVLSAPGYAVLGVTKVDTKASDMSIALQESFKKTVLAAGLDFKTARQAGCILAVNNTDLTNIKMDDLSYAFDAFNAMVGGSDVHRGLYGTDADGTRAYTIVCGMKTESK